MRIEAYALTSQSILTWRREISHEHRKVSTLKKVFIWFVIKVAHSRIKIKNRNHSCERSSYIELGVTYTRISLSQVNFLYRSHLYRYIMYQSQMVFLSTYYSMALSRARRGSTIWIEPASQPYILPPAWLNRDVRIEGSGDNLTSLQLNDLIITGPTGSDSIDVVFRKVHFITG